MTIINESLDYMDLDGQMSDKVTIDEYSAKMGKDKDIITITFKVYSKLAGEDLVTWFERGYDFVLDASISDGEIKPGEYLVFVEIERRSKAPERLLRLLSDLQTLTGYQLKDWTVEIEGEEYDADQETISSKIILNPNLYKMEKETDEKINEMRTVAGLRTKVIYENDTYIKNLKAIAGL